MENSADFLYKTVLQEFTKELIIEQLILILNKYDDQPITGRMYSLGEVNFIQGMLDFGNPKNSVGLKPNAELRKDAKAPSIPKS